LGSEPARNDIADSPSHHSTAAQPPSQPHAKATGARPVPDSTQYAPPDLTEDEKRRLAAAPGFEAFLESVRGRCEEALLQNAVADITADDLSALHDEDPAAPAAGADAAAAAAAAGGAGGGAAGRGGGGREGAGAQGGVVEVQSLSDLVYSRNKVGGGAGGTAAFN
jgi:hypothetical protein